MTFSVISTVAAFNLICTGTISSGKLFDFTTPSTEVSLVLRVNLDAKRWCSGDCYKTAPIYETTATNIVFTHSEDKNGDKIFAVNRENGEFTDRTRSWLINWVSLTQGKCERSKFTGFPSQKF